MKLEILTGGKEKSCTGFHDFSKTHTSHEEKQIVASEMANGMERNGKEWRNHRSDSRRLLVSPQGYRSRDR